ncbi:unnamed protein product [Blepharisma stoltei]|uniref:Meiosis-specific nuclear structural protein 1 n=1 Tax=Blepharisma stoltei TaxID=1481888 RepID=A0AAU9IR79_9CILI|nr:unnamed protein product [Blepharisma stoltei]
MEDSRNNIMFRKQKPYNGRNDTSLDTEFQAEQARLEQAKAKRQQIAESRRVALFGSTEEKSSYKQRINQDAQLQLIMREQQLKEQREREEREHARLEEHRRMMEDLERQREAQRRAKLIQMQNENRLAAMARNTDLLHKKVSEDRRDREMIQENIMNYQPNVF